MKGKEVGSLTRRLTVQPISLLPTSPIFMQSLETKAGRAQDPSWGKEAASCFSEGAFPFQVDGLPVNGQGRGSGGSAEAAAPECTSRPGGEGAGSLATNQEHGGSFR